MDFPQIIQHRPLPERIVSRLNRDLERPYAESLHNFRANGRSSTLIQEDTDVLLALSRARERLHSVATDDAEQDIFPTVAEVTDEILERLYRSHVSRTRLGLSNILAPLMAAATELSSVSGPDASVVDTVVIPSAMLLQAKQALFPAERMQVISGRRVGRTVHLEAHIDVTGESANGHVDMDNLRLKDARLDIEKSGTFLAMCLYSHPGEGPAATIPSSTDVNQHKQWLSHHWPRSISAIMVKDGYLRLFGESVDRKLVTVVIEGSGIERIRQEEADGTGTLYQVTEPTPDVAQARASQPEQDVFGERYVTTEALQEFEHGIKDLLRSFLDLFIGYKVEMNGQANNDKEEALSAKLRG